jgi:hypothetical protein
VVTSQEVDTKDFSVKDVFGEKKGIQNTAEQ